VVLQGYLHRMDRLVYNLVGADQVEAVVVLEEVVVVVLEVVEEEEVVVVVEEEVVVAWAVQRIFEFFPLLLLALLELLLWQLGIGRDILCRCRRRLCSRVLYLRVR